MRAVVLKARQELTGSVDLLFHKTMGRITEPTGYLAGGSTTCVGSVPPDQQTDPDEACQAGMGQMMGAQMGKLTYGKAPPAVSIN